MEPVGPPKKIVAEWDEYEVVYVREDIALELLRALKAVELETTIDESIKLPEDIRQKMFVALAGARSIDTDAEHARYIQTVMARVSRPDAYKSQTLDSSEKEADT